MPAARCLNVAENLAEIALTHPFVPAVNPFTENVPEILVIAGPITPQPSIESQQVCRAGRLGLSWPVSSAT